MKKIKGLLLAILSSMTFGFIPLFSIPLINDGFSVDLICVYRYFIAALATALFMLTKGVSFKVSTKELLNIVLLSLLYGPTAMFLTGSYKYMPSGISTTIHFLYPMVVSVIMVVFFREKLSAKKATALFLAILGVCFLCGVFSQTSSPINPQGILLVVISVLTYAFYLVGVNRSSLLKDIDPFKMTFYVLLSSGFIYLILISIKGEAIIPLKTGSHWFNAICLAIIPSLISNSALIYAIKLIGSTTTAILGCMEPLTAVIVGIFFFGEILSTEQIFGIFIVFAAVLMIILSRSKPSLNTL